MTDKTPEPTAPSSNPDLKHVVLVLDRSGSMTTIADDTSGGVARMLADQLHAQQDGGPRVQVTLAQFDHRYDLVYDRADVTAVSWSCEPRGMTALLDAVGTTIATVRDRDRRLEAVERPGKTVLVIVTDGQENRSTEYDLKTVRGLIEQCKADEWEVLFLASDQDAWDASDGMGIDRSHASTYHKSASGTRAAFASASDMTVNSVAGQRSRGFTDDDREAMTRTGDPETD